MALTPRLIRGGGWVFCFEFGRVPTNDELVAVGSSLRTVEESLENG
ncbi:MAG: hypothetical protein U9M95_01095 [Candidatus Altiarchaeota archaeon]|nr:hypothetical protein [Candidatus Altiarchaeota archaeon]